MRERLNLIKGFTTSRAYYIPIYILYVYYVLHVYYV